MKISLLILCALLYAVGANAQAADLQNNSLSLTQKMRYNRSGNHNNSSRAQAFIETAYLHETSLDGTTWAWADSSNQFNYDGAANLLSELIQTWGGTAWVNNAYDSSVFTNNNQVQHLVLTWNTINNTWVNSTLDAYTYDTSNYLTTDTGYVWNSNASSWNYNYLNSYAYDSNGNEIIHARQVWNTNAWQNNAEYLRTYDSLNLATSQLTLAWNNSVWDSTYLSYLNYDAYGNEISTYFLALDTATDIWNIYGYDTSTYEPISVQLTFEYLAWNADSGNYLPDYGYSLGYDQFGNNTYKLYYTYNDTTPLNTNQWFYYYQDLTLTGIASLNTNPGLNVYPDPASDRLTISADGMQADEVRLYDLTGQIIADVRNPTHNQVDVSQLSAGVYFAEVLINNNVSMMKWMKI